MFLSDYFKVGSSRELKQTSKFFLYINFIFLGIERSLDIVYIVSAPATMPERQLDKIKAYIQNSLFSYKIDPENVRVGVVQYPDAPSATQYKFSDNPNDIAAIIKGIRQNDEELGMSQIVKESINQFVVLDSKKQNPKVFVLVVRETGLDLDSVKQVVSDLRVQNVKPIIIYLGERDILKLQGIVENPDQVIQIDLDRVNLNIGDLEREIGKTGGKILNRINCFLLLFLNLNGKL